MVKQPKKEEEYYLKGLLEGGLSYRKTKNKFQEKFSPSLETIGRIAKSSKRIKKPKINPNPRKTSPYEDRITIRVIKKNRWESWKSIQRQLSEEYQINLSTKTIQRRAAEQGIKGKIAKKKPFISRRIA